MRIFAVMSIFFAFTFAKLVTGTAVLAAEKNYAVFVSPVRGREFWRSGRDIEYLSVQRDLLLKYEINNTWLLQYDALLDEQIVSGVSDDLTPEKGLFVEITPKLARAAFVNYDWMSERWERADKLFLSGYERVERKKLIDTAFEKFRKVFGYYPRSVGAWHIDSWSLQYMRERYEVLAVLGLADQYLTDGYQVWGQYIGQPYYPSKSSVLEPAAEVSDRLDMVKLQWAARDPLWGYGKGEEASNYSVQVNDYFRANGLGREYLERVVRTYTIGLKGRLAQVTLGLEVGELAGEHMVGLVEQLKAISDLGLATAGMDEFARLYAKTYPEVSPGWLLKSGDEKREIEWFFSPYYRAAVMIEDGGKKLVDLRYYHKSRYVDSDTRFADKRENLYRVVPAVVDQVGLGNGVDLGDGEVEFGQFGLIWDQTALDIGIVDASRLYCKDQGVVGRSWDWIANVSPDVRISRIEDNWVIGLRVGPEKLWGVTGGKTGWIRYEYPILESFLGISKNKRRLVNTDKCKRELVQSFSGRGKVVAKDSPYGIENMKRELFGNKLFEDSNFVVR